MTLPRPAIHPLGESALTLTWGTAVSAELNAHVHAATAAIRNADLGCIEELVPGYAALTVYYNPLHTDCDGLSDQLMALLSGADGASLARPAGRDHLIPVHYDGDDLSEVARLTGLSRDEVVRRHADPWYHVYLLGFAPGFAYLGDLDPALVLARHGSPRKRVPAGSVAIAGAQTAIYPLDTPGGWHLIGRTDLVLFDPEAAPPARLQPGDRVRFEPVGE
ncbi:MAG: 5-oxoprolinase subunit PxpB [Gemmatimonadales bacterium]